MSRNDKASPYTRRILHAFKVYDEEWVVTGHTDTGIWFEETEDSVAGMAEMRDGSWVLDAVARDTVTLYHGKGMADALEAFFNEHGPPPMGGNYERG